MILLLAGLTGPEQMAAGVVEQNNMKGIALLALHAAETEMTVPADEEKREEKIEDNKKDKKKVSKKARKKAAAKKEAAAAEEEKTEGEKKKAGRNKHHGRKHHKRHAKKHHKQLKGCGHYRRHGRVDVAAANHATHALQAGQMGARGTMPAVDNTGAPRAGMCG